MPTSAARSSVPAKTIAGGLTHFWEYGQFLDPIKDAERIRDHLLRAVYGTFATAKRNDPVKNANLELDWVGHIAATGEALRIVGDYILNENDIRSQTAFPDAVATCSGHFCLHFPGPSTTSALATGNGSRSSRTRCRSGVCTRVTSRT